MRPYVQANRSLQIALVVTVSVALLAVVVAMSTAMSVRPADANHGRSSQLSWHRVDADTAEFHSEVRYKSATLGTVVVGQSLSEVTVNFGDGSEPVQVAHTVDSIDPVADVVVTSAHFTHDYPAPGPFIVTAAGCCRISGPAHVNNADLGVNVSTIVDLGASGSPTSAAAAVIDCAVDSVCTFAVPATDPDSAPLRYRLATPAEAGHSAFVHPPGAAIDPDTGLYTWNTTGVGLNPAGGESLYSTQVIIERLSGEAVVVTHSAIDFLIRLPAPAVPPPLNAVPGFQNPTPAANAVILNSLPNQVRLTVSASDPDATDTVTIAVAGAPEGAVVTSTPGNPASATFTWTPTLEGNYFLTLSATDQAGAAASPRLVEIWVLPAPANGPPRVNADVRSDVNISGVINLPLLLSGEVIDPNPADVLTIRWDNNSHPCQFSDRSVANPYVTCSQTGTFRMTLVASDGIAPEAHDDIDVIINPNLPPAVAADVDVSGLTGQSVRLNGFVSDPNSAFDIITIAWTASDPGCSFARASDPTTTVVCTAAGLHTLTLTASDGVNQPRSDSANFTVTQANRAPIVNAGPDGAGVDGAPIQLRGSATDPDGDGLLTSWSADPAIPGTTAALCSFADVTVLDTTVTCAGAGSAVLRLSASDGSLTASDTVTVLISARNAAPLVSIAAPAPGFVNEAISLTGTVSDPDAADLVTVTWSEVVAPGSSAACSFGDTTVAVTTVTCSAVGTHTVQLSAHDGVNPPVTNTAVITVSTRPVDPDPGPDPDPVGTVNAGADTSGFVGRAVALDGTVTGPGTVRWSSGTNRCRFASRSRVDTTVTCSRSGTYTLTLTLNDGVNPPVRDQVVVTVTRSPRTPRVIR